MKHTLTVVNTETHSPTEVLNSNKDKRKASEQRLLRKSHGKILIPATDATPNETIVSSGKADLSAGSEEPPDKVVFWHFADHFRWGVAST